MTSLAADFNLLRQKNYDRLMQPHRKRKYPFAFLGRLNPQTLPDRVRLLDAHYLLMREVDDIVDGDTESDVNPQKYVSDKINFVSTYSKPSDLIEMLMAECHKELSSKDLEASRTLQDSTTLLLQAWEFDANRISAMRSNGHPQIHSSDEIGSYVLNMELYSIMQGALAILGEETSKVELLKPLVLAGRRHHYFLRDLAEDVTDGCVNISREEFGTDIQYLDDFVKLSTTHSQNLDLSRRQFANLPIWRQLIHKNQFNNAQRNSISTYFKSAPDSVLDWARAQVSEGKQLLGEYRESEASKEFGLLGKLFLHTCYERRAETFLNEMDKTLN